MMADVALRPLKALVGQAGFFLKHVVQLFSGSFERLSITLRTVISIHIGRFGLRE